MKMPRIRDYLLPAQSSVSLAEQTMAALSAFAAIAVVALASDHWLGGGPMPFLIASMGASAVLLFAAPHSPLAQPWSFVAGHLVSAVTGVTAAMLITNTFAAAGVAVAVTILLMHLLRCLHPPGGATALFAVLGGESVRAAGYGFVLAPIGVNVLALLVVALIINNVIPGRRWPSRQRISAPTEKETGTGEELARADLVAALRDMNVYIDVTETDLKEIYALANLHARRRQLGEVRVADIMQRDVPTAEFGDELETIWALMRADRQKGVVVIDRTRRIVGIVTIVDFLKHADASRPGTPIERMVRLIRRTPGTESDKPEVVGQIMTPRVITVRDDAHIVSLVPLFAEHRIHHLPVVDALGRLLGMVTQSDLLAALHRRRDVLS